MSPHADLSTHDFKSWHLKNKSLYGVRPPPTFVAALMSFLAVAQRRTYAASDAQVVAREKI
jgi:hypothetical protein